MPLLTFRDFVGLQRLINQASGNIVDNLRNDKLRDMPKIRATVSLVPEAPSKVRDLPYLGKLVLGSLVNTPIEVLPCVVRTPLRSRTELLPHY
jgi:hypothetical protein